MVTAPASARAPDTLAAAVAACVQSLVLRTPAGPAVRHLVLTVPDRPGAGSVARHWLDTWLRRNAWPSFGVVQPQALRCALGLSFAGLERLGLPVGYQRVFRARSAGFAAGAALRAQARGEGVAGRDRPSPHWADLAHERAHLLLSLYGDTASTTTAARDAADSWSTALEQAHGEVLAVVHEGQRIGAPQGRAGEWVHFGYRDGLSELRVDALQPASQALDPRPHEPGTLLLGHPGDEGGNPYALSRAPQRVRQFFHHSSFGMLRPMVQDTAAFEQQVRQWAQALPVPAGTPATPELIKAKLGGRWPGGLPLRPGQWTEPAGGPWAVDFAGDAEGIGCPFGSHVRRMRAAPDRLGHVQHRVMQRRSFPFGKADWSGAGPDDGSRGLLGHFFAASVEDVFEHLLGQWAARPPLGAHPDDTAQDPLLGPHEAAGAALRLPWAAQAPNLLKGWQPWARPLGTLYAWYPSRDALEMLLRADFEEDDREGPWR